MKKLIAIACAAVFVLVTAAVAVTPGTRTEFEGLIHFCESISGGVFVTPGGTIHGRNNKDNVNLWDTGNAFVDGMETNVVDFDGGTARLDVTLIPIAVDGTWEITLINQIRGNGTFASHGVGYGTGDLSGMTIRFTTSADFVFEQNPCSATFPSAPVNGVISAPADVG